MNRDIDDIFKEGIGGGMEFSRREELWQQMEKQLDEEAAPDRKKRLVFLLLFLCFVAGAAFLASNFTQHKNNVTSASNKMKLVVISEIAATAPVLPGNEIADNNDDASAKSNQHTNKVLVLKQKDAAVANLHKQLKRSVAFKGSIRTSVVQSEAMIDGDNLTEAESSLVKSEGFFEMENYAGAAKVNIPIVANTFAAVQAPVKKVLPQTVPKLSLYAVAGSDIFNLKKGAGYYAGLKLNRSFGKGMSLSVGVNYSASNLSESYRLTNKPSQQREADAEISRMVMLRFPIMIEQQMGKSKFTGVAGLVPVYILDAAIYNVPPSVGGNPDNYRQFTINDIKRLNVLFSAGIRYNVLRRLAVDITGSYGLTEMVKNSYINQSSVNGNFKNVQVGVVYLLR